MLLHCTLHLISLLRQDLHPYEYERPSDETLQMLRNKYQYLKVLIADERSMIGREALGHFDVALKIITKNLSPFGEVSLLIIGYFLQLLLANQKGVSMKPSKE